MTRSIVIVDDDRSLLEGMRESIPWSELNLKWVGEAIDGRQGIEVINDCKPDIVLTDINMPIMNGLEMIEYLCKHGFNGSFIILSGYTDFEYARQAVRLQVDDYLSKPISYESLRKVIERVTERLDDEEKSEQDYIKLHEQLELYKPYLLQEWVRSVVTGSRSATHPMPDVQKIITDWTGQRHVLIGIELGENEMWEKLDRQRNMIRFVVHNVASEMVAEVTPHYDYVELHSTRFVVFLHNCLSEGTKEQFEEKARQLCIKLKTYLKRQLKLELQVKLGEVTEDWRTISDTSNNLFGSIKELENDMINSAPLASVQFYHELAESVRNGHIDAAKQTINAYIVSLNSEDVYNEGGLQKWADDLWAIMAYALYDIGIELDRIVTKFHPTRKMTAPYTPELLGKWLVEMVEQLIEHLQTRDNSRHRQMTKFMIRFVHENYSTSVTLKQLADELQLSRNYLGQIFRNVTGETFNQYLTRVRIGKAKEMIMEGELYIYEIAEKVGYTNIPYFSSQFKKITGVNPTDLIRPRS